MRLDVFLDYTSRAYLSEIMIGPFSLNLEHLPSGVMQLVSFRDGVNTYLSKQFSSYKALSSC